MKDEQLYPGKVLLVAGVDRKTIIWCGLLYDYLYVILDNGDTYRLDHQKWTLVASLPLMNTPTPKINENEN